MYYRYKIKKKERKFLKGFITLALIVAMGYFIYTYRSYLMIWKYTDNKLIKKIEATQKITSKENKKDSLLNLAKVFKKYRKDNPVKAEAYLLSGYIHFLIAKTYLPESLTDIILFNNAKAVSNKVKSELMMAIQFIKKAKVLLHSDQIDIRYAMVLAKSLFFCDYEKPGEIYSLLAPQIDIIKNNEDIKFYSFISIINNKHDDAILTLKKNKIEQSGIKGKLFLAMAEKYAKHYNNSIKLFKEVGSNTKDVKLLKIIHENLGDIYKNQSLYKEAISEYLEVFKLSPKNIKIQIIISNLYISSGDKQKAEKMAREILKNDPNNITAKNILKSLRR